MFEGQSTTSSFPFHGGRSTVAAPRWPFHGGRSTVGISKLVYIVVQKLVIAQDVVVVVQGVARYVAVVP